MNKQHWRETKREEKKKEKKREKKEFRFLEHDAKHMCIEYRKIRKTIKQV